MRQLTKKGQLTLFVIASVVILLLIGGYLIFQDSFTTKKYDPKVSILKDNLLDCFKGNYEDALEISAYQGGYIEKPDSEILEAQTIFIPYYYYEGKDLFPTKEKMEKEIGKASQNLIDTCITYYPDSSYDLSYKDFEVFAEIKEKEVLFITNMELIVKYDNRTVILEFKDFDVYVDSKLYDMYEVAKVIANQANTDPEEWIDLTEIYEEVEKRDLNATILGLEEEISTHLFIIETESPYVYPSKLQFLNKYSLKGIGFPENLES